MKLGRSWPLVAFLLALAPRLLFFLEWNRAGLLNLPVVDAATFDGEARSLLAGTWPGPEPFWQAPLYSYLLAGLYRLVGWSWPAARLLQAFVGAGTCVLVYALARRRVTERWARVAFGIAALYGPLIYFEGQLLRETLGTFLLALWAWLEDRGGDDELRGAGPRRLTWAVAGGATLALVTLCRENALILAPAALAWRLWRHRDRNALVNAAAWAIAFALVLSPVTIHNARTSRTFVPISTGGGINLFLANNAHAKETLAIRPGRDWNALVARPWREARALEPADEARFLTREALTWMTHEPIAFAEGLARKTLDLCAGRELKRNLDLYEARHGSRMLAVLMWKLGPLGFPFGLLAPLAAVGLFARGRRDPLAWMTLLFAAGVVLFFPSARHRLPIVPFLIIFATIGLVVLTERSVSGGRRVRLALVGALVFVLALLGGGPLGASSLPDDPSEPHFLRGTALAALERDAEATRELEAAVRLSPTHEEAWADLAVLRGRGGELARAEDAARRAVTIDSTYADAWADLASVRAARGDTSGAEADYRRALKLEPDLAGAAVGLARLLNAGGRADEALALLEEARGESPRNEDLALLLSALQSRAGRIEASAATLEGLTRFRPRNADAWNNLGIARAQLGRRAEARAAFLRALEIAPNHESARRNLARIDSGG